MRVIVETAEENSLSVSEDVIKVRLSPEDHTQFQQCCVESTVELMNRGYHPDFIAAFVRQMMLDEKYWDEDGHWIGSCQEIIESM
jgi:hypothetical protein